MIVFLSGNDHFRLRLREYALRTAFESRHVDREERVFDGRDPAGQWVVEFRAIISGGLFAQPRVIAIRHIELLEEALAKRVIDTLSLASSPEVLIVASAESSGRAKKADLLEAWLTKHAEMEVMNTLTGRELPGYVLELLRDIDPQAKIEPRAAEVLAFRTGGATGVLYHELLKLVLMAAGAVITETDVLKLTREPNGESVAFALLDAIVRGDRERAVSLLRREEKDADAVFRLLGLVAWQVRQALMIRDEYDRGVTSADTIARTIGAKPFTVRKLIPLLPQLPLSRLKRAIGALADLDRGIKTGQIRPGVALDLFVWKF